MKKLAVISSLAVIVAGGAAAVPYYVGNKAERYITEPQTYEQGQVALHHRGESYERGYLSSRAQTRLTWQLEDEIIEFAATHEIDHAFTPRIVSRFRVLPDRKSAVEGRRVDTGMSGGQRIERQERENRIGRER